MWWEIGYLPLHQVLLFFFEDLGKMCQNLKGWNFYFGIIYKRQLLGENQIICLHISKQKWHKHTSPSTFPYSLFCSPDITAAPSSVWAITFIF